MKHLTHPSGRTALAFTVAAAIALAAAGVMQVTHEESGETTVVGAVEHLLLVTFSFSWLALAVPVVYLARRGGDVRPAAVAVVAQVALAAVATVSNVRGEDPSFFPAVAAPTNLLILASWIAIGVALRRRGGAPIAVAAGLPVAYLGIIPAATVGGPLASAAVLLGVVAWAARERRPGAVPLDPAPQSA